MLDLLKIVVCSLKSVKGHPGVQNDSPMMNTLGSLDSPVVNITGESRLSGGENIGDNLISPVMNTPGRRFQGVSLEQASEQVYKKIFLVINRPGSQYVLCTSRFFVKQFRSIPWW
jgi:hypothetical protein